MAWCVKHAGGILFLPGAEWRPGCTAISAPCGLDGKKTGICYGANRHSRLVSAFGTPLFFMLGLVWLTAGGGTEAAIITLACSELQSPANWLISAL